jgi:epsilon-lactone hydrolase
MRNLILVFSSFFAVAWRRLLKGPRFGWSFTLEVVCEVFYRYIDWMMGEFSAGRRPHLPVSKLPTALAAQVSCGKTTLAGLEAEWIRPKQISSARTILYIHGGGFVTCSIDTHRELMVRIALASNANLIAMNYRLAPEFPFPAMQEDCLAAYQALLASGVSPHELVVAGDSAGGSLTLSLVHQLKEKNLTLPAGLVTLSPSVDMVEFGPSWNEFAGTDYLGPMVKWAPPLMKRYLNGAHPKNPLASPVRGDLKGFPPTLVHVGGAEILRDQIVRFAEAAKTAGVEVEFKMVPNAMHVFHAFARLFPASGPAIDDVGQFIQRVTRVSSQVLTPRVQT